MKMKDVIRPVVSRRRSKESPANRFRRAVWFTYLIVVGMALRYDVVIAMFADRIHRPFKDFY